MLRKLLVPTLLLLASPLAAGAQAGSCVLRQDRSGEVIGSGDIISVKQVVLDCGGGTTILANEANIFLSSRQTHLFGNVRFQDPTRRLTSNNAIYSSATGYLHATGDVVFSDVQSGSTLRGPDVEYWRAMPGRPQPQMIATGRPHLTLVPEQRRGGERQEPLEVDGDRVTFVGDDMTATGSVVLRRPDLTAYGNQAQYGRATGRLNLLGNARVDAERYDLSAEQIDASMPAGGMDRLVARTNAILTGEQLRIQAPELHLFFGDDRLQRLVARQLPGAGSAAARATQPVATAQGFRLQADSLEAVLPSQRLETVVAVGNARGENRDTVAPAPPVRTAADPTPADTLARLDRDWITGDTIVGRFEPRDTTPGAAGADTAVVLRTLVARGAAQSLYRLEARDTTPAGTAAATRPQAADTTARPAPRRGLNFLAGDTIALSFRAGQLDEARVTGLQRGLYLDPLPPRPAAPAAAAGSTTPAPTAARPNPTGRGSR